jgi:hypothetical protein
MIEILNWIFESFIHFVGTVILLKCIFPIVKLNQKVTDCDVCGATKQNCKPSFARRLENRLGLVRAVAGKTSESSSDKEPKI